MKPEAVGSFWLWWLRLRLNASEIMRLLPKGTVPREHIAFASATLRVAGIAGGAKPAAEYAGAGGSGLDGGVRAGGDLGGLCTSRPQRCGRRKPCGCGPGSSNRTVEWLKKSVFFDGRRTEDHSKIRDCGIFENDWPTDFARLDKYLLGCSTHR